MRRCGGGFSWSSGTPMVQRGMTFMAKLSHRTQNTSHQWVRARSHRLLPGATLALLVLTGTALAQDAGGQTGDGP
jgi:hypothetical protein